MSRIYYVRKTDEEGLSDYGTQILNSIINELDSLREITGKLPTEVCRRDKSVASKYRELNESLNDNSMKTYLKLTAMDTELLSAIGVILQKIGELHGIVDEMQENVRSTFDAMDVIWDKLYTQDPEDDPDDKS